MAILKPAVVDAETESASLRDSPTVLALFTAAWERGETPAAETYLARLDPADPAGAVELIYREYCLSEQGGQKPEAFDYLDRFPQHQTALERLLRLHGECSPSLLGRWMDTMPSVDAFPRVGDEIGPFILCRELGRGGFARVFLAEQANLENRLVVLKVSTRMTREPWILARVRHTHIVEIVSHAAVDDGAFHLICMPFWGGATLAAVLAECRLGRHRPSSGNDLLVALDSVAAAEFPTVNTARPAREIVTGLSFYQAVAWLIARLAEALDYAFSRDVAHGDVKPSNILLSADGNPLLLDFNLARDSSPTGLGHLTGDLGGTLAYMAPERLPAVMNCEAGRDPCGSTRPLAELDSRARSNADSYTPCLKALGQTDFCPHKADIYSLGVVMLEALSGRPPLPVAASGAGAGKSKLGQSRASANGYAVSSARSARDTIRQSEAAGRRAISPGLRAILERCLDPDPSRRYRRGLELAEDLDRWRTDRPLVYTHEPLLRQAIPRLLRRQRRTLFTAVVALVVVVATTTVVLINAHQTLQALGSHKLGRMWDDPERRAVRFQRPNAPRLLQPDESHVETAVHALKEYDLLDSDQWRTRDDVRTLPKAERDDLEVWLGEQVYMYCRALEKRPDSPDDWRRALKVLGHFAGPSPIPALAQLQHLLRDHLGAGDALSPRAPGDLPRSARLFSVNEYLLGVVAESAAELPDQAPPAKVGKNADTRSPEIALDRPYPDRPRIVAERALHHYNNFLELRPDSFWGHYRAASVAYGLGGKAHIAEAANHLDQCLTRRSNNPTLHHHRAVCLIGLDQYREAHREVQIAIEQAPDVAEFYRTRATIRANLRVTGELATDLRHFELLTHLLPRAFWGHVPVGPDHSAGSSDSSVLPFEGLFALGADLGGRAAESKGNIIEAGPGEFEIRVGLATAIRQAGEFDLAEVEFAKILLLEPDHIGVRMTCAMQAVDSGRLDEALPQLNAILNHPDLIEYLRNEVVVMGVLDRRNERTLLDLFYNASRLYCHHGKLNEGRAIARRAVDLAIALHRPRGMAHFNLARAYAASVPSSSEYVGLAATQLFCAFVANPLYKVQYANDSTFDAVRTSIDAELVRKPDSAAEYHRRHKTKTKVQAR